MKTYMRVLAIFPGGMLAFTLLMVPLVGWASHDIEFEEATFRIAGTDRTASLAEIATASFDGSKRPDDVEPGLYASENFTPSSPSS